MKFGNKGVLAALAVVPVAFMSSQAHGLQITLDDTVNAPLTIMDNGPGDTSPQMGDVSFNGAYGNWSSNTTTGLSQEILIDNEMDLNSVNVSNASPSTLIITLEDEDFIPNGPFAQFAALIGGTTNGTVSTETYFDSSNTVGVLGTLVNSSGPFTGAFADTFVSGDFTTNSPYGLAIRITIVHQQPNQVTSFNHNLSQIPEPTTLGLMGLGLIATGLIARRRERKS